MCEVKILEKDGFDAWDEYVQSNMNSGPYLNTMWKRAVQKAYNHETVYLYAYHNKRLVGALPFVVINIPFLKRHMVSLPFCDYGGLITEDHDVAYNLLKSAIYYADALNATLEIRCPQIHPAIEDITGFENTTNKCRMLLNLPHNSQILWSQFKAKLRSQIRKSLKHGLKTRIGRLKVLDDFYYVFSKHMKFLGSPVHSKKWLKEIIDLYDEKALICIVYNECLPIGAGLILMHNNLVTIPWASTLHEFKMLNPNMLLYWKLLEYAADHSYRIFDFGRSTPGEGTYAFKEQWCARPAPLYWYRYTPRYKRRIYAGVNGDLHSTAEKLWRRMPLVLANALGPQLRKYIDR